MGMKILIEICLSHSSKTQVSIVNDQCKLDIKKYSFSQRTTNEWNILSADCVNACSVNIFESKIDKYICRAGYTSTKNGLSMSQWLPCPPAVLTFDLDDMDLV